MLSRLIPVTASPVPTSVDDGTPADIVFFCFEEDESAMRVRTFAALMVALLLAWPVAAQEQRGSIEGVVRDASGAVLPGRRRSRRKAENGAVLSTTSDAAGNYRFPSVAPGTYVVTATLAGFAPGNGERRSRRPRPGQEGRLRAGAARRRPNPCRSRPNRRSSTFDRARGRRTSAPSRSSCCRRAATSRRS